MERAKSPCLYWILSFPQWRQRKDLLASDFPLPFGFSFGAWLCLSICPRRSPVSFYFANMWQNYFRSKIHFRQLPLFMPHTFTFHLPSWLGFYFFLLFFCWLLFPFIRSLFLGNWKTEISFFSVRVKRSFGVELRTCRWQIKVEPKGPSEGLTKYKAPGKIIEETYI